MANQPFELEGVGPNGEGPFRVPSAQSVQVNERTDAVELLLGVLDKGEHQQVLVTIPNRFGYQLAGAFKRAAED